MTAKSHGSHLVTLFCVLGALQTSSVLATSQTHQKANCLDQGSCRCPDGTFVNAENLCEPKRDAEELCDNDNQCRSKFLCNPNGRCGCNETHSILQRHSDPICKRKAGLPCADYRYCERNAVCKRGIDEDGVVDMVERCHCHTNEFFQTEEGTCEMKRNHGEKCRVTGNCKDNMICVGGTCECDTKPDLRVYDPFKKECVVLANSQCKTHLDCATNSECVWNADGTWRCKCKPGYPLSNNGSCTLPHDYHSCTNHWLQMCNPEQNLVCGIRCECKYGARQEFDKERQTCLSKVGGPCGDAVSCVENAHCAPPLRRDGLRRCECNEGYIGVDGGCKLTFGQPCQNPKVARSESQCDGGAPLQCVGDVCQCYGLEVYDHATHKCRGRVGHRCSLDKADYCATGSECRKGRYTNNTGTCECQKGWTSSEDLLCTRSS